MDNDFGQGDQEELLFKSIETMPSTEIDKAVKKFVKAMFTQQILVVGGMVAVFFILAGIFVIMTTKNAEILEVLLAVCFWLACVFIFLLVRMYFYQEKLKSKVKNIRRNRSE